MDRPEAELSILVTDDREIEGLNRNYRNRGRPTDVLAFPQTQVSPEQKSSGPTLLGDVVISLQRAEAQALEQGVPLESEMRRLLAHGVLHLLGFDHEISIENAGDMRKLEDKYAELE